MLRLSNPLVTVDGAISAWKLSEHQHYQIILCFEQPGALDLPMHPHSTGPMSPLPAAQIGEALFEPLSIMRCS